VVVNTFVSFVGALLLTGCHVPEAVRADELPMSVVEVGERTVEKAKICEIRSDRARFVDSYVLVDVTYFTDSSHYASVEDHSCSDRSRMSLRYVSNPPQSVRAFFDAGRDRCDALGKNVCLAEARLTAVAKVVLNAQGIAVLDLVEVRAFEFIKP
jgi:hypothetical protein